MKVVVGARVRTGIAIHVYVHVYEPVRLKSASFSFKTAAADVTPCHFQYLAGTPLAGFFQHFQETACTFCGQQLLLLSGLAGRSANVPVETSLAQNEQRKMLQAIAWKLFPTPH